MNHNWHIRPYRDGDEKHILELRRTVFGKLDPVRLKESTWQWQFQNNPAGKAMCMLAESNGEIVGQYASIPTRFSIHGKETRLAFSCDTMVHPGFRRQGMFTALAREHHEFFNARSGIDMVWGFPNDSSRSGFTGKLGWQMLPVMPLMVFPIRPLNMIYRKILLPAGSAKHRPISSEPMAGVSFSTGTQGVSLGPVAHFDESFDRLWQAHSSLAPVIQIRDSRYLQWRYLSVPEFGYRPFAIQQDGVLTGYVVIRMMTVNGFTFGALADVFPFPLESLFLFRWIVSFAKEFVKARGGDFLTFLLPREHAGLLKKAGFKKVPEVINPRTWRLGFRRFEGCPFGNPDYWHVTYGDTDVV